MIVKVAKTEAEDLPSAYDLEYRANEDDAWYSVSVVLDTHAQTLTIKYLCSPDVYEVVFSAGEFKMEAQIEELVRRFRPVSQQLQDHQCGSLTIGTTVCAAYGTRENDLRFYDAVIEAVNKQIHSFAGGEEECLCTFVLWWQHGCARDTLTSVNIASICSIERVTQIDPRISAFATLAKEKITSSKSISVFDGPASGNKNSCGSIEQNLESSQNRFLEMETSLMPNSLTWRSEDRGSSCNYDQWRSQDEDIGPVPCNIDGLAIAKCQHFIVINNLEKDLTPSSIKNFIYKHTAILPQAFVFPRLLSDPFARGAILVDCQKKVQTIYEFLDNPNYLIVSSRGRPWVITEKALMGTFRTSLWSLMPMPLDEIQCKRTEEELEIVHSGTKSYERAKQLRDLVVEFIHHETEVSKKLVWEERKIWLSFRTA